MDTKTQYLGLELKSPIVVGSCGLTSDVEKMVQMEQAGAGAVVLKSVFEEQIIYDIKRNTHIVAPTDNYGDSYEYIAAHVADDSLEKHFNMIREAKRRLTIPVIGSINCFSYENWVTYARQFQDAGCDALELNMAILPYETSLSTDDVERTFTQIINTRPRWNLRITSTRFFSPVTPSVAFILISTLIFWNGIILKRLAMMRIPFLLRNSSIMNCLRYSMLIRMFLLSSSCLPDLRHIGLLFR